MARPYRGLSVQEVDLPLTEFELMPFLLGREVYRRSDYLALRNGGAAALVAVRRASDEPLFSPVVEARVLGGPDEVVWIDSPETDPSNATAMAKAALTQARPYLVQGRDEHVNFIFEPTPITIGITEDLPPVRLVLDAVDLGDLAAGHPAGRYLLPCRGSGVDLPGAVSFLDTRPAERKDWLLIGCERSLQFHRPFYGDEPEMADICPRTRFVDTERATLTKCCLLERGVEFGGRSAVVPWGSNLDEIRAALRWLTGVDQQDPAAGI